MFASRLSTMLLSTLFTIISLSLSQPTELTNGECMIGRVTIYDIHTESDLPQGTCGFGPVYDDMP